MKQPIRAFSIGLFTAGMILLVVNYFSNGGVQDISEMPVEDVIEHLKEDGYRVLTESEYITLSVNQDKQMETTEEDNNSKEEKNVSSDDKEKENDDSEDGNESENDVSEDESEKESETKDNDDNEKQEETTVSYTINIESGMASSNIAKELEENNIIDNADEFNRYLDKEGYSIRIQLGEFTVSSDMSFYELAEVLTNN